MYNPFTKELYHAVKGGGAFLNGRRLKASRTTVMDQAIVVRAHSSSVTKGGEQGCPRIGRLARSPFLPDLVRRICGRTPGYRRLVRPSSYRMHRYTDVGSTLAPRRSQRAKCFCVVLRSNINAAHGAE